MKGIETMTVASIVFEIGLIEQFSRTTGLKAYIGKVPDRKCFGGQANGKRITRIRNRQIPSTIYEALISIVRAGDPEFNAAAFYREVSRRNR